MALDTDFSDMKKKFVGYPVSVPFGTPCTVYIVETNQLIGKNEMEKISPFIHLPFTSELFGFNDVCNLSTIGHVLNNV